MKHLNKLMFALALAVVLAVGGTSYALEGPDDSPVSNSGRGSASTQSNEPETGDDSSSVSVTKKAAALERRQAKTAEAKQQACQSRKQGLENKFSRIVTNSERINSRIDEVLNKAITFHDENSFQISNWDDLLSAANDAGDKADQAIVALKEVKPSVDCNNVSVASDVKAFKEQAASTRDALKDYRKAVKAVLKALLTAKQEANSGGEGSDQ